MSFSDPRPAQRPAVATQEGRVGPISRWYGSLALPTKLILAFLLVALIPLSMLAIVNDRFTRAVLTDDANRALAAAARQTATGIDTFIDENLSAVQAEAQLPALVDYLSLPADRRAGSTAEAEAEAVLQAILRKDLRYISSYALLDRQGVDVLDTHRDDIGLDKSDRNYFQEPVLNGLPYVSPVQFSAAMPGLAAIYFSSPVRGGSGQIIGVLRVRYHAAVLQQLVEQSNGLAGEQSFAVLFDENHIHLGHGTAPETIFRATAPLDPALVADLQAAGRLPEVLPTNFTLDLPELDHNLARAMSRPFFSATDVATGGSVNQIAVVPMESQPWLVAFFQPQEVYLAPSKTQTRTTLLLALVIAAGVAAAAVVVGRRLARPILRLTAVAQQVATGALSVQVPVDTNDEIGHLAGAFNRMTAQLRQLVGSLEDQVQARTAELVLSIEVGQRSSAIRDLAVLLPDITEFIRERFDLYYTQVYFVDDTGRHLVLKAGSGAVGQELLARGHSLPVGPGSIVGRVAAEAQPVVVADTAGSELHKPNPLLPETRSELAVPLVVEGRVIGVLDMQANQARNFTEEKLAVFEAMATQLAISIDSARQWAAAQEAQRKLENAVKRLTRESWAQTLSARGEPRGLGFVYDLSSVAPVGPQARRPGNGDGQAAAEAEGFATPLVIQDETVGKLAVAVEPEQTWSEDEQVLLRAVGQQLAQKIENIRLFEETQKRAAREQLVRQITERMQQMPDVEAIIETGLNELARALGVSRAYLKFIPRGEPGKQRGSTDPAAPENGTERD